MIPSSVNESPPSFFLHPSRPLQAHRISGGGDTVKLAVIAGPGQGIEHSVIFEIWEPGGAQPFNSHPISTETFLFLGGSGEAQSDGARTPVSAGQFLVLPPASIHRITNTGHGRLYAITTMMPDAGFADLIERGPAATLDPEDLMVLGLPCMPVDTV